MPSFTYKLARQRGGIGHYAVVTVDADPADDTSVALSDDAGAWLREAYGPRAIIRIPPEFAAAAVLGATNALQGSAPATRWRVVISELRFLAADTSPDDVQSASFAAVVAAIQSPLPGPARIRQGGEP
jgi:hypothetical protein